MLLKCLGNEEKPHEQVQWNAVKKDDKFCWFCDLEGYDLGSHIIAANASMVFR